MAACATVAVDRYHRITAHVAQGDIIAQATAVTIPADQQRRYVDMIPLRNREVLPGIASVAAGIIIGQQVVDYRVGPDAQGEGIVVSGTVNHYSPSSGCHSHRKL